MNLELIKRYEIDHDTKRLIAKCFLGATAVISTICIIRKFVNKFKCNKEINKKINEVNKRKINLFQKLEGMKSPFENIKKICYLSGIEISSKVQSGEVAPVDILEAYQANSLIKNNDFNFIADIIYDADVTALCINYDSKKKLMGWPMSVKDTFCIEKYDCTQGLFTKILQPCSKSSVIIKALRDEGAIPFIITNVCQGLQNMESSNPVFGRTLNPCNHSMSPGGSSAGEGSALASGSSLIGIGNDIGGSIRIPASYCGIYGLTPTSSRVSMRHTNKVFFCDLILKLSIGPMARHIDDLIETFKVMTSSRVFDMDPYNPPVPFNESLLLSYNPMKIGFYSSIDGLRAHPVPAVERAIILAKKALEAAGHEVVEFNLPKIEEICSVILKIYSLDGGKTFLEEGIKNGPVDPSLRSSVRMLRRSRFVKYVLSSVCRPFNKQLSESIWAMSGASAYETWKLKEFVLEYRELVLSMLEKDNIDGLICPVLPIVAPPFDTCKGITNIDVYCAIYNVLDYPAGTVPVTFVSNDDITKLNNSYRPNSYTERQILKSQLKSLKLPVGVQCVAKPWRDETCLRIMKDITLNL